ncbi:MAG TPA: hypothetical protein VJ749_00515 [Pyrinomonadaceae bacterium]|nr:hypothetical protein [Pyrinomonadaceae bacterium]
MQTPSRKSLLALAVTILAISSNVIAQKSPTANTISSLWNRDEAIQAIRQQLDDTKTFNDPVQRIAVLIRAADLLWPYEQPRARAAFNEAFDVAVQNFKEKGDAPRREGVSRLVETPDQRFIVVQAIARRDPGWAKKLTEDMLKKDAPEGQHAARNTEADVRTATKILNAASLLLSSDSNAAIDFARVSFNYPASLQLTRFLYSLAQINQKASDELYQQALAVYGDKPLGEFLYLSAYPFGADEAGDMPYFGQYSVPATFGQNPSLQRLFIQVLLQRAQQALQLRVDEGDNYNQAPGTMHILDVLTRFEPAIRKNHPQLIPAVEQAHNRLLNSLSPELKEIFLRPAATRDSITSQTFDEQIEAAEKEPNTNKRDELLVNAILNAAQTENVDHVVDVADKITALELRQELLDWLYFDRAQSAIKNKRLDEATRLTLKVREIDQRAYLYSEIAKEALGKIESEAQAREQIENIVTTATQAPNTITRARALLSAASLYLKVDAGRSIAILSDAVRSINQLESPDFSATFALRKLEGKNFARYAAFKTPGFNPENVFRQIAEVDFANALAQASSLMDKKLRATCTLALAEFSLQRKVPQDKPAKTKTQVKS